MTDKIMERIAFTLVGFLIIAAFAAALTTAVTLILYAPIYILLLIGLGGLISYKLGEYLIG